MKCPICFVGINESWRETGQKIRSEDHSYHLFSMNCPECKNDLLRFTKYRDKNKNVIHREKDKGGKGYLIPLTQKRKPLPDFVPEEYIKLYEESYSILDLSPRASAALSRTCLQLLLREYGKVKHGSLSYEIQQVMDLKDFPSELKESIGIIRENGNNATHPNKNDSPMEIISVDHDEAELSLEILDLLFDYYIIEPSKRKEKTDKFNKKHPKKQDLKN